MFQLNGRRTNPSPIKAVPPSRPRAHCQQWRRRESNPPAAFQTARILTGTMTVPGIIENDGGAISFPGTRRIRTRPAGPPPRARGRFFFRDDAGRSGHGSISIRPSLGSFHRDVAPIPTSLPQFPRGSRPDRIMFAPAAIGIAGTAACGTIPAAGRAGGMPDVTRDPPAFRRDGPPRDVDAAPPSCNRAKRRDGGPARNPRAPTGRPPLRDELPADMTPGGPDSPSPPLRAFFDAIVAIESRGDAQADNVAGDAASREQTRPITTTGCNRILRAPFATSRKDPSCERSSRRRSSASSP